MSVITQEQFTPASQPVRHGAPVPALACILAAAATAAFLWAFALPMIGLVVFVSKFFAG